MSTLNIYGDQNRFKTNGFGADIATQRADNLDLAAIEFAQTFTRTPYALDVACGMMGQSLRLAQAGCRVIALDRIDFSSILRDEPKDIQEHIHFVSKDLSDTPPFPSEWDESIDLICCQRAIHYFPYVEALQILKAMRSTLQPHGKVFLSASGIRSELSQDYPDILKPLQQRYAPLSKLMQIKHDIRGPVCLYSESDFEILAKEAGFKIQEHGLGNEFNNKGLGTSLFGNIKAILTL